jgi:hypothetical protein
MTNRHELDQAIAYQIRLKGVLDSSWSDWFGGFSLTVQGNETVLVGSVPDQAALHGILAKINDLGLSIVSINKLPQAGLGNAQEVLQDERENENHPDP